MGMHAATLSKDRFSSEELFLVFASGLVVAERERIRFNDPVVRAGLNRVHTLVLQTMAGAKPEAREALTSVAAIFAPGTAGAHHAFIEWLRGNKKYLMYFADSMGSGAHFIIPLDSARKAVDRKVFFDGLAGAMIAAFLGS